MAKKQKNKTKVYEDPMDGFRDEYYQEADPFEFPKFLILLAIGIVGIFFLAHIIMN